MTRSDYGEKQFIANAWIMTPMAYMTPDGKTIKVDKTKEKDIVVASQDSRHILEFGVLLGHASICGLSETSDLRLCVAQQASTKKWSEQRQLYAHMLGSLPAYFLSGRISLKRRFAKFEVAVPRQAKCTEIEKARVGTAIRGYIK